MVCSVSVSWRGGRAMNRQGGGRKTRERRHSNASETNENHALKGRLALALIGFLSVAVIFLTGKSLIALPVFSSLLLLVVFLSLLFVLTEGQKDWFWHSGNLKAVFS